MTDKLKDTFTIEELCEELGIEYDDGSDWDFGEVWSIQYDYSLGQGKSEEEAREEAQEAMDSASEDEWKKYAAALENVFEDYFGYADLEVIEKEGYKYKLLPKTDWKHSATEIVEIINGVGYFRYDSLREFLDSGPYTPRQAVLSHLHWIKQYGNVFGTHSPEQMLARKLRY